MDIMRTGHEVPDGQERCMAFSREEPAAGSAPGLEVAVGPPAKMSGAEPAAGSQGFPASSFRSCSAGPGMWVDRHPG